MELVNPNTGTIVRAEGVIADRLLSVGFKPAGVRVALADDGLPESVVPLPLKRGPGRPKKK